MVVLSELVSKLSFHKHEPVTSVENLASLLRRKRIDDQDEKQITAFFTLKSMTEGRSGLTKIFTGLKPLLKDGQTERLLNILSHDPATYLAIYFKAEDVSVITLARKELYGESPVSGQIIYLGPGSDTIAK